MKHYSSQHLNARKWPAARISIHPAFLFMECNVREHNKSSSPSEKEHWTAPGEEAFCSE